MRFSQIKNDEFKYVYQELQHGNIGILDDINLLSSLNMMALDILDLTEAEITEDVLVNLDTLIKISNIVYNNTETPPPIEDSIYDRLMVIYRKRVPEGYQIGAPVVNFNDYDITGSIINSNMYNPVLIEPQDCRDGLFHDNLRNSPPINYFKTINIPEAIDKSKVNTSDNIVVPHKYPKLVGTLDKCKFVLNKEAMDAGCFEDNDIQIFERDFLGLHLQMGIINQYRPITLILELKYDGMSVEADVTNRIISARSRGDTNQDLAEDLTPVLQDYVFPNAPEIPINEAFGVKFECIITKENLYRLGAIKGKTYKNGRNGVIGLMKSKEAYAYRDLITLVPLETSLDMDPIQEIEFMNRYFATDTYMKYAVVTGSYTEVLFQVYKFVKEAEMMRDYLPFMYDGVVVHYYDKNIRNYLGRKNSVNKYSIAIKFNPAVKETTFLGYDFTVGQNGVITPMIHYSPVEFIGTIHTKSSGHSLQRFNELNLSIGDRIEVEYRNDVMPYVVRRVYYDDTTSNRYPVEFPSNCPVCGTHLEVYDSGRSAVCPNYNCPGRIKARVTNMVKKLNIKGFAESAIEKLGIVSFSDMLSILQYPERAYNALGVKMGDKFYRELNKFMNTNIDDYRVIGSLGFTDTAIETWKKILHSVSLKELISDNDSELRHKISLIPGIGPTTVDIIINERGFFANDINTISELYCVKKSYGKEKKKIRYSGCRPDPGFTEYLESRGFDADPNGSVTRTTDVLVVPNVGYTSSKLKKCGPNTMIVTMDEFTKNTEYYISYILCGEVM